MKTLVIATAAKDGGGLTILNSYLKNKMNTSENFVILSPEAPKDLASNMVWIKKQTGGLSSIFFALFISWIYCLRFGCDKIVSFSNYNSFFSIGERVTYFQNFLILNDRDVKYRIIRAVLKYFNQRSVHYIFQTSYVADEFCKLLYPCQKLSVCWPGIELGRDLKNKSQKGRATTNKLTLLSPITNVDFQHKNFKFVQELSRSLNSEEFEIVIPTDKPKSATDDNVVRFVGKLDRDAFLSLMAKSDAILITSLHETVCLPVFEALALNTPVVIYNAHYVAGIKEHLPKANMHYFNSLQECISILLMPETFNVLPFSLKEASLKGNWDF